jgi:HK97 family phage prohead protease
VSPNQNRVADADLEHRSCLELRAEASKIVGYAVVFDVRSRDLGGFVEVVRPQACAQLGDVVALFNHDSNQVLGRTPATLQLRTDSRGLAFTLDPAPTQAGRDALALVSRGDVTGASFGFRTKKDQWRKDDGVMIRELLDIELAEISLTAFPAYPTDVSIAQRSLLKASRDIQHWLQRIDWLRLQARAR